MSKCPAGTFWNSARQCQPIVAPSSLLDEQRKFDKDPQRFISEQRTQVALAQPAASAWPAEVTDSLRETRAPQWAKSPNSLSDLRPGDVVLVGPDDSPTASAIMKADRLARIATDLVNGRSVAEAYVNTPSREVSHVAVAVQPESGPIVFLDHTSCSNFKAEGCTKLLSIDAFRAKYGARPLYVARPVAPVHAGLLWALAEQAAKWKANDYGMFGQDVVCSERVGIAVARATGSEHLRRDFLPVDILPSDFLVDQHYHFVVKLLRP
jgi:hypothetical protein